MADSTKNASITVLSGTANPALAKTVCAHLHVRLGQTLIRRFLDGELDVRVDENVRGSDVFIIQPTCYPQNDTLMELLMLIDSVKRASAKRITAVIPYYGYARKDRKDEGRVPITAKLVANEIVTAGANRVLAMDLHAAQIQGFFDIPVDHLFAKPVFLNRLLRMKLKNLVCASPDMGSMKMALSYAKALNNTPVASCYKVRDGSKVSVVAVIGDVNGKNVLLVDDLIASGSSLVEASKALKNSGARDIYVCATHAVMCGDAFQNLGNAPIKKIMVTDTIPLQQTGVPANIEVVTVATFLAEAIWRIHKDMSVSRMFGAKESPKES